MPRVIEEEIVSILSDYKVYPTVAPIVDGNNDVVSAPFVIYNLISGSGNDQIGNTSSDLIRETYQIDYYANSSLEARVGADAIYQLLCSYNQAVIYGGNQRKDSQDGLHRFSRDYDITYSQDVYNIEPPVGEIQIVDFENVVDAIQSTEYESDSVELVAQSNKVYQLAVRPGTLELNDDGVWLPERLAVSGDMIKLKRTSSPSLTTTVNSRLHYSGGSKLWQITTASSLPYPTVNNGLLWLSRAAGVYSDVSGTVEAGIGEAVASWRSRWGSVLATQSTSGARPTFNSNGILPDGSNDYLDIPTIPLHGAFTIYWIATLPNLGTSSYPIIGTQSGYPYFFIDIVDLYYGPADYRRTLRVSNYTNLVQEITGINNTFMFRLRRTASNTYSVAATGLTEINNLAVGNFADSWAYDFAWIMKGIVPTDANCTWKQLVVVDGDTVVDGTDTAIRAKLNQLESINL